MVRTALVVGVAVALVCCGCGGSHPNNPPGSAATRAFIEWDATGTINEVASYKQEVAAVIQRIARANGEVFAAVLDGQPLTTASIMARNFAEVPPGTEAQELPAINQAVAAGFAHNFIANCTTHEVIAGSGQLQGLALAAATPGVSKVFLFSDAVVNEAGFDLSDAHRPELEAEIARWKPKLAGLKSITVTIIGAGRGAHHLRTVEWAHRLFHEVVDGNGGHLVWDQVLAQQQ